MMFNLNDLPRGLAISLLALGCSSTFVGTVLHAKAQAATDIPHVEQAAWSEDCDPINDYSGCRGS